MGMSESPPIHGMQAVVWDASKLVQEALSGQGQPGADLGSLQRAAQVVLSFEMCQYQQRAVPRRLL